MAFPNHIFQAFSVNGAYEQCGCWRKENEQVGLGGEESRQVAA